MTDAEQLLWFCLRRKQLGSHFRRQHPINKYVLDYYCQKARLVVELDGGQHNDDQAILNDSQRTAFLERRGIKVIRIWNDELFKNLEGVLEVIYHALQERVEGWAPAIPPLPNPPPPGEGTRNSG